MRLITIVVTAGMFALALTERAQAQLSFTGISSVDSAAVARMAWASGSRALRGDDFASARREIAHAASAWPTQPAYHWARARLAAHSGDSVELRAALLDYAALGIGRDLLGDSVFAPFAHRSWFNAVSAAHDANRTVIARSTVRATLSDSTLWPEGVDYDSRTRRYYVASVRHRTIVELSPDGSERELLVRDASGNGAVLGVRVDPKRNVVWATMGGMPQMEGYTPADSAIASLVRVRISDGMIERRWDLPVGRPHALGDLVIGAGGDVFVTDSYQPLVYRLRARADTLETITHPLFRSLQGLAPTSDGRFLYLADYAHGLLRLDLESANVIRLAEPSHVTTLGVDGIALYHNAIIGVQNGVSPARVMRFQLDWTGEHIVRAEVLDRNWRLADEPTIGTIVGNEFVYVANSQWEKFTDDGGRKKGAQLTAAILLALPLGQ